MHRRISELVSGLTGTEVPRKGLRVRVPCPPLRLKYLLVFAALFHFAGLLSAQDQAIWLDSRVSNLPTDKLGPFVHTSDGKVMALDSEATFVSHDGGETWSEPRPLSGTEDHHIKVSNERAMMRTKEGTIIAAFMNLNERKWTWNNELHDAPGAKLPTWVMRSEDAGKTWNHVQKMHDDWSGAVRDMIQTKDGRIIFTAMKMQHDPGRHAVLTYSSEDDGKTWKASNLIDLGGKGHHGGVTEPTLTELADGRLWMLIRTNWGQFWSAYSHDGGRFWRIIQPSGIAASSAPGLLKRLAGGRLLLVWNRPYPEGKSEWKLSGGDGLWSETPVSNHRDELSLALSDDEGKTWSDPVVVARTRVPSSAGKNRWIAYPYVFQHQAGQLWLTTMQGNVRILLHERNFVGSNKVPRIVAFGDSTTASRGDLGIYSIALAEQLSAGGRPARVINAGVGGNHTDHARARFERDVLAGNPDIVIIQFGINDAAVDVWKVPPEAEPRVTLERFEANLRYFVASLKARGSRIILMTPNPLRWTPKLREMYGRVPYDADHEDGFNVRLREYAETVRKLARAEGVALIDVYESFQTYGKRSGQSVDDLLLDGMHPNERGHRLIADLILKQLDN
jgi:sialidase-1